MTVKELWDHFNTYPSSFALDNGNIAETTPDMDRMLKLIEHYGNRRVKNWTVGFIKRTYYLHVWLESEKPMPDKKYIDAEMFFNDFPELNIIPYNAYPAADVQEVRHALDLEEDYPSLFECSACHWSCNDTLCGDTETYNYCPNCGAKINGGKDNG